MRVYYVTLPILIISLTIIFSGLLNITYGKVNVRSQTYENPEIGIKLSHPSDWGKIVELTEGGCHKKPSCALGLNGTNTTYRFGFSMLKLSKDVCNCNSLMDTVRNAYNYQSTSIDGFSFIKDNQTTTGKNYSSWQYQYSFLHDGEDGKGLDVFVTNNGNYYQIGITYPDESQAKLLPQFKKVIDSIEFLPIQNPVTKKPSFMNTNMTGESIPETNIDKNLHGLQILSHNSFTDSTGNLHVVGEIKNNYPSTTTFVRIIGTFYDVNNHVVGTQYTYANPSDIASGQKAPFKLILTSASVPISQIDHYNLQASYQ